MLFDINTIKVKLQLLCTETDEDCYEFLYNIFNDYSNHVMLDIKSMYLINATLDEISREIMKPLLEKFKYDRHYFTLRWYPKDGPNKFVMVTRQHIEHFIKMILSDIVNSWGSYLKGKKVTNEQMLYINKKMISFKKMNHARKIRMNIQNILTS